MEKSLKAEYDWHAKANTMLQRRKVYDFDDVELADFFGMTVSEARELLTMQACAAEYLRSRGKENHWSLVSDKEDAFRKIVSGQSRLGTCEEQELFKHAAFTLIDSDDTIGMSLSKAIPKIQEYLQPIRRKLLERFPVQPPADETGLGSLFGGSPRPSCKIDIPLAMEIQSSESTQAVREVAIDVNESQSQLEKNAKVINFLVKMLMEANAKLAAALSQGLRTESKTDGAESQLRQLEEKIVRIRQWLADHA